jgi:MFS family permease
MIKLFKVKEIRPLLVLMSFTGIITAFYSGFLSSLIKSTLSDEVKNNPNDKNQAISAIFIVLGASEVFAGFVIGMVTDKVNLYTLITMGTLIVECALILSLISSFYESYIICFFLGGLWGKHFLIIFN